MNGKQILALIRATRRRHYVYVLSLPDGSPFYVGVGTLWRVMDHERQARRADLDSHKLRVIRKLWHGGLAVDYSIVGWFDERADAEHQEVALIAKFGRRCDRSGPLTNVTAGGEGALSPSEELRARRSQRGKEAWAQRDKVAAMAHLRDPEVRARATLSRTGVIRGPLRPEQKGWKHSKEVRAATSARLKANPISQRPDVAAKISRANAGKVFPDHYTKRPEYRVQFSGVNNPMFQPIEIKGRQHATAREAAAANAVCIATIESWIRHSKHGARRIPRAAYQQPMEMV